MTMLITQDTMISNGGLKTVGPEFTDVYGLTWDKIQCDQYNKISREIWEKESLGMDTELLKNDRFRIYQIPYFSVYCKR